MPERQIAVVTLRSAVETSCTLVEISGNWLVQPPNSFLGMWGVPAVAIAPATCTYECGESAGRMVVTVAVGQGAPTVTVTGGSLAEGVTTSATVTAP